MLNFIKNVLTFGLFDLKVRAKEIEKAIKKLDQDIETVEKNIDMLEKELQEYANPRRLK